MLLARPDQSPNAVAFTYARAARATFARSHHPSKFI